jgi:hypothetical protein
MLLRDHPLISYRAIPTWPPAWTWIDGQADKRARGEIGTLKAVTLTKLKPANCCYLYSEYEGSSYAGCLLFDDRAFCAQISKLLQSYCNRPITEIGSIDLAHTL